MSRVAAPLATSMLPALILRSWPAEAVVTAALPPFAAVTMILLFAPDASEVAVTPLAPLVSVNVPPVTTDVPVIASVAVNTPVVPATSAPKLIVPPLALSESDVPILALPPLIAIPATIDVAVPDVS